MIEEEEEKEKGEEGVMMMMNLMKWTDGEHRLVVLWAGRLHDNDPCSTGLPTHQLPGRH